MMQCCRCGWRVWLWAVGLALAAAGCSPTYHRKDADREVYRILDQARQRQVGLRALFSIEPAAEPPLVVLRRWHEARTVAAQGPGPVAKPPEGEPAGNGLPEQKDAARLTLADALELAARYSREYQSEKEDLYLAALALTLERHNWKPSFFATFTGAFSKDKTEKVAVDQLRDPTDGEKRAAVRAATATAAVTGTPVDRDVYDDAKTRTGESLRFAKSRTLETEVGVSQLLATGGEMTIRFTTNLARVSTTEPREAIASVLSAEIMQPLLRGGGRLVARENLTQAERDTVYAVRSFARFRRTFAVTITSQYFRVLQQRDTVINGWENYKQVRQLRQRSSEMAQAGRRAEFEVDQARQNELRARDSWVRALQQYQEQLDEFKITLGLPTEAAIELDPAEIDSLRRAGPGTVALTPEGAMATALERRLDLLNVRDQMEDGERTVTIARNGLSPDLAMRLGLSMASRERRRQVPMLDESGAEIGTVTVVDQRRPGRFSMQSGVFTAGVDGELPLDRKSERNAYRTALISLERAKRTTTQTEDQVKLSVRQVWRNLEQAAQSYHIQLASVDLAHRRVESTNDLLQRGDATVENVLDANDDLVNAQNALTRALIDHQLARLGLWRDTELLRVDEHGVWQELNHED
ncbi:TolC family protein [bacterium]|nr:TolC family protein [bacterium]